MTARRTRFKPARRFAGIAGLALALAWLGCGGGEAGAARRGWSGAVRSGGRRSPISGSTITLYAAGTSYGRGATRLARTTSAADGSFTISAFVCPAGNPETYATAVGGASGFGANPEIGLMAVLGPCNHLSGSTVVISELTTVAGEWALAQFSDSTGEAFGAPPGNAAGFRNAVRLAMTGLANLATGGRASFLANIASSCSSDNPAADCDGLEKLDTLANIVAACVNSVGPSSSACMTLFTAARAPDTGATLQAAHAIAANPGRSVDALFGIQSGSSTVPFTPALSSAPAGWTLGLNHTGGGLNGPQAIAIDASGDVWVANYDNNSVTELSPDGTPISPPSGYRGGGLLMPQAIAIDASGNVWVANGGNGGVTKLNLSGAPLSPPAGFIGGGLDSPYGIAIGASGDVWVANYASSSVTKFSSSGAPLSPPAGFTGGGLTSPSTIAIDASGNVWVSNAGNDSVTKLGSSGVPLSPPAGFTGGGLRIPAGIAIGAAGNVWVSNAGNNSVTELKLSGAPLSSPAGFTGGHLNSPRGIAIDSSGNVWMANAGNSVTELDSSATPVSPASGYRGGGLLAPQGIAIDASGNVWVPNFDNDSVTELVGAAAPTRTPLAPGDPIKP